MMNARLLQNGLHSGFDIGEIGKIAVYLGKKSLG